MNINANEKLYIANLIFVKNTKTIYEKKKKKKIFVFICSTTLLTVTVPCA